MKQQHVTRLAPGAVRLERLLPGPIERVWSYIVDGEKRARWLAAGDFEMRVGGRTPMQFDNNSLSADKSPPPEFKDGAKGSFSGVVTRLEPMRVFAHTWAWQSGDTEVTYELTPKGNDVLLTIEHRRLADTKTELNVMSGWHVHTGILEDILKDIEPRPFWKEHTRMVAEYRSAVPS